MVISGTYRPVIVNLPLPKTMFLIILDHFILISSHYILYLKVLYTFLIPEKEGLLKSILQLAYYSKNVHNVKKKKHICIYIHIHLIRIYKYIQIRLIKDVCDV